MKICHCRIEERTDKHGRSPINCALQISFLLPRACFIWDKLSCFFNLCSPYTLISWTCAINSLNTKKKSEEIRDRIFSSEPNSHRCLFHSKLREQSLVVYSSRRRPLRVSLKFFKQLNVPYEIVTKENKE